VEHVIREATEINLHPNNMKREECFSLSKSWKLQLHTLKEQNKTPVSKER